MSDEGPIFTPRLRSTLTWTTPAIGVTGVGLLLWLGLSDGAHTGQAVLAAIALAALTVILTLRLRRILAGGRMVREEDGVEAPRTGSGRSYTARSVFETFPEPLMIVWGFEPDDIAGRRVLLANAVARDLFRITGDNALLVTVLRDPEVLEAIDEALFGGLERRVSFLMPGAQDRLWRASTRPLSSSDPARRLAVLHLRDETDIRQLEEMRVDFLANASHELRSPLASLSGFIETLKGPARDDEAARDRFLDIMAVQADRMGRLIADLLSLSRIELNEHVPPRGSADLALIVGDVVDAVTPAIQARGVTVALAGAGPGEARVLGDRDQILQVIQNLVDNAVKYSPDGAAVEIEVLAEFTPAEAMVARDPRAARLSLLTPDRNPTARYAGVRVRDHGKGIAREHLPRLSERFYRVEGQKSGDRLGTGLGLAIVKHIINRHRGGLVVESTVGEGAAFTAYLPQAGNTGKSTASPG